MNHLERKIRPPFKTHGGKYYLARRIIDLVPDNISTYAETFCGGASVFLNLNFIYQRAILNDTNPYLINFFRVLRYNFHDLYSLLLSVSYSQMTFDHWSSIQYDLINDSLNSAAKYYIVNRMSRGGLGKAFAWSDRLRGGKPGDLNAWETALSQLQIINNKLHGVDILNVDAITANANVSNDKDALLYLDPPYVHKTRIAKKAYGLYEYNIAGHINLLNSIINNKCKTMISGYRCDLYDTRLSSWRRVEWSMPNHSGQGAMKQKRTESLWLNF